MSFKVLVIPEDPTNNGYILKPLVEAILADARKPNAKVTVLSNPHVGGFDQAKEALRGTLVDKYSFMDLWIFIPDADCATFGVMDSLEVDLRTRGVSLLCCAAQPEVEIFACVARRGDIGMSWEEVRKHPKMKEIVFEDIRRKFGNVNSAGGGRASLIIESIKNMPLLYSLCPELKRLRDRIAEIA